jgi:hypothetical protein
LKTTTLALSLLLVGLSFAALAPTASAFDWCVEGTHKDCRSHLVCIGRSWSAYSGETCKVGVARPCPYDCHYLP